MVSKFVVLCAILAYCNAQTLLHHPQAHHEPLPLLIKSYAPVLAQPKGHAVSSQSIHLAQSAPSKSGPSLSYGGHARQEEEEYGHPAYEFKYSVSDPHTGDEKSQSETRDGDVVKGEYELLQPDGQVRKVTYQSDKHSGFTAHVSYTPTKHA